MTRFTRFLVVLIGVTLASCARQPIEHSRLDSSGLTVVTLGEAVLLAHAVPRVAAGARDYAYIGPVEINRMGLREFYLWISLASTIDREYLGLTPVDATELVLIVDDEAMEFSIGILNTDLDVAPYASSAPVYATLEVSTTLDQIRRIAAAETVELHLIADTNRNSQYQFWKGDWAEWQRFPEGL